MTEKPFPATGWSISRTFEVQGNSAAPGLDVNSCLQGTEPGQRGWIAKRTAKSTSLPEGNPASLPVTRNRSAAAPPREGAKKVLPRANHPHVFLPRRLLEAAKLFWLKLPKLRGNPGQLRADTLPSWGKTCGKWCFTKCWFSPSPPQSSFRN